MASSTMNVFDRTIAMSDARKVAVPLILAVWVVIALVALYSFAILPWFIDYCDFYSRSLGGSFQLAVLPRAFARFHLAGIPLGLAIFGYGFRLLVKSDLNASHPAWYISVTVSVAAGWQMWAMLAERSLYELLFPA
jgi:hypothetical protein